ncbi:hypothetical protein [Gordonia sputi]
MTEVEPIASLLLDERNPRFSDEVDSQEAAITEILAAAPTKLLNLARDIATEGTLNPTELPVVVDEEGDLVVVEGNRRLAALKLLRTPELAKAAGERTGIDLVKRFKSLQAVGIGPDNVEFFLADSREAARHWIELRHTGENEGVGVLGWEAWQANNYRRRRGSQADRANVFCEAVEIEFPEDASLLEKVAQVRRERLTTLGRLVADPDVRRDFGFDLIEGEVYFDYTSEELFPGIDRIFSDLSTTGDDRVTVTSIKTKDQRKDYVKDRSDALPDRSQKLAEPRRPGETPPEAETEDDSNDNTSTSSSDQSGSGTHSGGHSASDGDGSNGSGSSDSGSGSAGSNSGSKNRSKPLERVIFQGVRLPRVSVRVREVLRQAQKVNIVDSPQIAGIMVRIVVELVVTDAIQQKVVPAKESDPLRTKLRKALLAIDPQCENPKKRRKDLEPAWTRSQDGDNIAVQALHSFVHNVYGDAAPTDVRALSLAFRPLIEGVDELIGNKP